VTTQTTVETPNYTLRTVRWPLAALLGALLADLTETLVDPARADGRHQSLTLVSQVPGLAYDLRDRPGRVDIED